MVMLLHELIEKLKTVDEVTLLEILNIDSEMLADRFSDLIEENQDKFTAEYEDDELS